MRASLSRNFIISALILAAAAAWAGSNYDFLTATQYMAIGTTSPSSKAALDISSTTKGLLPPRMTTTQKNAITSPPDGLMVYDTSLSAPFYSSGGIWNQLYSSLNSILSFSDTSTPSTPSSGTVKVYSKAGVLTALNSTGVEIGLQNSYQIFTASGTFTVPSGVTSVQLTGCGGGGGGGGGAGGKNTTGGGGGGGGEGAPRNTVTLAVTPGATITVTIGAGGTAGAGGNSTASSSNGTSGTAGGDGGSTIFSTLTFRGGAHGGAGVGGGITAANGGAGGGPTFNGIDRSGSDGGRGTIAGTQSCGPLPGSTALSDGIFAGASTPTCSGGNSFNSGGSGGYGGIGGNGSGGNGGLGTDDTGSGGVIGAPGIAAAANTCAGGGGGGGNVNKLLTPGGGAGGAGGSGYLAVYW